MQIRKIVLVFGSIVALQALMCASFAADAPASKLSDKYITRGEMAVMLSATNFMKQKISALLDFATGYNLSTLNRSTLAPIIRSVRVVPYKVPSNGRVLFLLTASVDDPGGLSQITGVKADLSNIGRLSETTLVDTGLWGDERSNDGVYTLQTSTGPRVTPGDKEVSVAATNKQGWLSISKTDIVIEKSLITASGSCVPMSLRADGASKSVLYVQFDPPEKASFVKSVIVDLTAIGGSQKNYMSNDGSRGDSRAGDNIFSLEVSAAPDTAPGEKKLAFYVNNSSGILSQGDIYLDVVK